MAQVQDKKQKKALYSVRNGKINTIELAKISEFKDKELQRLEELKRPKGIHSITKSDGIQYRIDNKQTKLWYYDKKKYHPEDEDDDLEENKDPMSNKKRMDKNGQVEDDEDEDGTRSDDAGEKSDEEARNNALAKAAVVAGVKDKKENDDEEQRRQEALEAERSVSLSDPRKDLQRLPTLAELMLAKPDAFISESSSAPSDRSGPPPEPVPEKIISTKIVTTSGTLGGRKLNLRI